MQIVLTLGEPDELKVGLVSMLISTILPKNCSWMFLLARTDITQVRSAGIAAHVENSGYDFLCEFAVLMGLFARPEDQAVCLNFCFLKWQESIDT